MAVSVSTRGLLPNAQSGRLLLKWLPVVLVPIAVFTFVWSGETIVNQALLGVLDPLNPLFDHNLWFNFLNFLFVILVYGIAIVLQGYLVAADSGRSSIVDVWLDTLFMAVLPIVLLYTTGNLLIGLGLGVVIWAVFNQVRKRIRIAMHYAPPAPLESVQVMDAEQQAGLLRLARLGGFWFATLFAVISLILDLVYFAIGSLPALLLPWVIIRTILLIAVGYFLGSWGGKIALRYVIKPTDEVAVAEIGAVDSQGANTSRRSRRVSRRQQLQSLSASRAREEAKDIVPNDKPLQSKGATRLYMYLFLVFLLLYPIIDPVLFGAGSRGRISSYGDLGFYVILALGLNIVVGFAGLLDLGYVAFFVIGTYAWSLVGSPQLYKLTGILITQQVTSWFFWPMIIIAAIITALWGILLGAPTLRLRGDYLAIVTLGFGEIIPIVFTQVDSVTNGANGIAGVYPPATPCIGSVCLDWFTSPTPYFYLILILIALSIFANVRLRDSKLGRAWIAIREDEIAAASSGINLVNTKLFAFAAGAFFAGVAGAYHAAKLGAVSPGDFNTNDSYIYLSMVVLGGLGSIPGVLVGAVVVYSINLLILNQLDVYAANPSNLLHLLPQAIPTFSFENIKNLLFGVILVSIMIFRPEGLIPSARRQRELHKPKNEPEESSEGLGSLDEPPGSAEFGAEVQVE